MILSVYPTLQDLADNLRYQAKEARQKATGRGELRRSAELMEQIADILERRTKAARQAHQVLLVGSDLLEDHGQRDAATLLRDMAKDLLEDRRVH